MITDGSDGVRPFSQHTSNNKDQVDFKKYIKQSEVSIQNPGPNISEESIQQQLEVLREMNKMMVGLMEKQKREMR